MDYYGQGYVRTLNSINKELKRLNDEKKRLTLEKKKIERFLYEAMKRTNVKEYQGYKTAKLSPKEKIKPLRKKKKEKYHDAIRLFTEVGIPDPEGFWNEFQRTQKIE